MKKFIKYCAFTTSTAILTSSLFASTPPLPWKDTGISMGTLFDNSTDANDSLTQRPVTAVFTYAGQNGAGDRGQIVAPTKITNTLNQVATHKEDILPVFVFYTADASGGGTQEALIDIQNSDYLLDHYENLIQALKVLEATTQRDQLKITSTLIMNPDFIGNLHKEGEPATAALSLTGTYSTLQATLQAALKAQGYSNIQVPSQFADNTLPNYVQSLNWLIGTLAPDVPYGWQDNDWAGTTGGNLWIHQATSNQTEISTNAKTESDYINAIEAYKPITLASGKITIPSFIAFDRYGADVINPHANFIPAGYLFNADDWSNYLNYVHDVGVNLNNLPIMLFQMPGAHLPVDTSPYTSLDTTPDYFFGNQAVDTATFASIPPTGDAITTSKYYVAKDTTVGNYLLTQTLNKGENLWKTDHLQTLINDNIFAVLWGGGGFATGVIPQSDNTYNDNGWLFNQIQTGIKAGSVVPVNDRTRMPLKDLPTYDPNKKDYFVGYRVVTTKDTYPIYQCKVASWCNAGGTYAPGQLYSDLAWTKIMSSNK